MMMIVVHTYIYLQEKSVKKYVYFETKQNFVRDGHAVWDKNYVQCKENVDWFVMFKLLEVKKIVSVKASDLLKL